jgi:DNA polymerase I
MMKNPYLKWKSYHIGIGEYSDEWMKQAFYKDRPTIGGSDTESTGLHIIKDKPFLIQFGWLVPHTDHGRVFTFYPTPTNMRTFFELANQLKYHVLQNTKYDLHMLTNIGYADEVQAMTNLCENMVVARLALEATTDQSLALKKLGAQYVHPDATKSESIIKDDLHRLNAERIKALTAALKQFDHPTLKNTRKVVKGSFYDLEGVEHVIYDTVEKPKKWGKGLVEKFLKDPTNDLEDLPKEIQDVWTDWQEEYPEPTYEDVDRPLMIKYGGEDIITMLEFFKVAITFVEKRQQLPILERENKCILPMYRMERVGLKVDKPYLEESRLKVKAYITELRNEMCELACEVVTVGQHARLKDIFREKWNIHLESDDKKAMKSVIRDYEGEPNRFATLIKSLRSLEKWYTTYILPIIKNSAYDGKVYTQLFQAGAVSGRMSSNFQQFPKDALLTLEGEELYHPRKAFVVKGGEYESTVYIDYDQIELVTQAHYTLLVSGGDLNLCRAYMPFKCRHYRTNDEFDYKSLHGRLRWNERQDSGVSVWLTEEGEPWVKTDVHAQTTHKAFPHIPLGTAEFKKWRSKGKIFNFLANYGGGKGAAIATLDLKEEEADALVKGYNEAFPGVVIYQKAIQKAHAKKGYVHNHYGRRYYLSDTSISYKLANYNIQGTCADALKEAIIRLDAYLKDKRTKMVIPIHDEIQFDLHKEEEWVIPELLKIMQETFDWALVPVTAGVEETFTCWADKKEKVL